MLNVLVTAPRTCDCSKTHTANPPGSHLACGLRGVCAEGDRRPRPCPEDLRHCQAVPCSRLPAPSETAPESAESTLPTSAFPRARPLGREDPSVTLRPGDTRHFGPAAAPPRTARCPFLQVDKPSLPGDWAPRPTAPAPADWSTGPGTRDPRASGLRGPNWLSLVTAHGAARPAGDAVAVASTWCHLGARR